MAWPAHIVSRSSRIPDTEPIKNKFFGLYNAILIECFPTSQFTITPQFPTGDGLETENTGKLDCTITFVIESLDHEFPVLFMEVKAPTHLAPIGSRQYAEKQIRSRFGLFTHLVRIPKLYGISAMGKQLSYYTYDRASGAVEPAALPDIPSRVVDTAPVERWDTNIMQEEGRTKFLAMVEEIKQMVRDL